MALEDDLESIGDAFDSAGGFASSFRDILDGMPASFARAGFAAAALNAQLTGTASTFDVAAYKLSGFGEKAAASTKKALTTGQKMAGELPGAFSAVGSAASAMGGVVVKALSGDVRGALSQIGGWAEQGIGKLREGLASLGPYGAAVAAAIGVLTTVVSATAGTLLDFFGAAIKVAETKSGLLAVFSALGGGAAMGAKTLAMVGKVGAAMGGVFSGSQVSTWAKGLQAAGIQGNELESAIKAVGAAQALMGESGAAATEDMLKKLAEGGKGADTLVKSLQEGGGKSNKLLAEMGLNTGDLAKALGKTPGEFAKMKLGAADAGHAIEKALAVKGAGPLEELGLTFPVMVAKVKAGFMSLFGDLGGSVKPLMQAAKGLFGEFSKGGGVINVLKPIVTAVMTTLFAWATKAVTAIHGIVTWLLASGKAGGTFGGAIAVLKAGWSGLVAIFGIVKAALAPMISLLVAVFSNAMVLNGIKTIFTVIAAVIVATIVVIAGLVAAFAVVAAAIGAIVGAITGAIYGMVGAIVDGLSSLDFGAFVARMSEMAQAGLAAFKGIFGIHSPSTVMLEHGEENIAGATATGIDKGGAKVDRAMGKLGGGPKEGFRSKAAGGGGSFAPVYNNCTFGGGLTQADVDEMNASWWERQAQGGPEMEAT